MRNLPYASVVGISIDAFIHGGAHRSNSRGPCWSEYRRVYVGLGIRRSSAEAEGGRFKGQTFRSAYGLKEELHVEPRPTRNPCTPKPHGPTDSHIQHTACTYILYTQLLVHNPHVNRWRRTPRQTVKSEGLSITSQTPDGPHGIHISLEKICLTPRTRARVEL